MHTHVAGAALDLVFCSGGVSAGRFTVHQGDDCCLLSRLFVQRLDLTTSCVIFNFLLWTNKKFTELMLTEFMALAAVHESRIGSPSCSLHGRDSTSGLSLYRIVQCSMADYQLCAKVCASLTIWLRFSGRLLRLFIQGHQSNRVKIVHVFHPIVSTSTGWFALLGVVSGDVGKTRSPSCAPRTPHACASRIRRQFRVPTTQHVPHGTMQWRPALVDHTRPCDGWRAHFSSVNTSSTHEDFSADFYLSMTRRFYELTVQGTESFP